MWDLFTRHRVHIATSFYTDDSAIHDSITGVVGSYHKTLTNIKKALALGLTLRVGMVRMQKEQRVEEGKTLLAELGVKKIGVDRARGVGRGVQFRQEDPVAALCGACTKGKAVITASGEVYNCIMSRSFPVGNVLEQEISAILHGETMQVTTTMLDAAFAARKTTAPCPPDDDDDGDPLDCEPECDPKVFPDCPPDCCPETVASCEPTEE
jgi:MoaA/NifB/PqqE/SkfB family radical SAM enzyme